MSLPISDAAPLPETASQPEPDPAIIPLCRHVKINGVPCSSPAMKGYDQCYYHVSQYKFLPLHREMFYAPKLNPDPGETPFLAFQTPELEDAGAIQIAYMQLLHGVANARLKPREAQIMLSALHGARKNLKQMEACLAEGARAFSTEPPKKQPTRMAVRAAARRARRAKAKA
jgi:hypothetical protein